MLLQEIHESVESERGSRKRTAGAKRGQEQPDRVEIGESPCMWTRQGLARARGPTAANACRRQCPEIPIGCSRCVTLLSRKQAELERAEQVEPEHDDEDATDSPNPVAMADERLT